MRNQNFSQRVGVDPSQPLPLLDSISVELRISTYNIFQSELFPPSRTTNALEGSSKRFAENADEYFFTRPVSDLEYFYSHYLKRILGWFQAAPWNKIYEFVEFCLSYQSNPVHGGSTNVRKLRERLNLALERHWSGYRIVETILIPISNAQELVEVEKSIGQIDQFASIGVHIRSAANLLNPATNPNFRNSVKESISAVEAAAKIISGKDDNSLGPALNWLEQNAGLHGALKSGFSSMYGWTSSADGIRHALMDDDKLSFEEAKFMLVACSAFANYLVSSYLKRK